MQRPKTFDGQLVDATFMGNVESDLASAILQRAVDGQVANPAGYFGGAVTGLAPSVIAGPSVQIQPGVAYDASGERVEVLTTTTIGGLPGGAGTYQVIATHVSTDGSPVRHPVTFASLNTRRTDSAALSIVGPGPYGGTAAVIAILTVTAGPSYSIAPATRQPVVAPGSIADDRLSPAGKVVTTTVSALSNGQALPTGTINVASAAGFPTSGALIIPLTTGIQIIRYTGLAPPVTPTSFTGCTGGIGTLATGNNVSFMSVSTHAAARGTGVFSAANPHANAPLDFGFTPDQTPLLHQADDHGNGIEKARRAALLTVASADPDAGITYTATTPGLFGNGVRVRHVRPDTTLITGVVNIALPQVTIPVASTQGFPSVGSFSVVSTAGVQVVSYTGTTPTSFTGCTGGTGAVVPGAVVYSALSVSASLLDLTVQLATDSFGAILSTASDVVAAIAASQAASALVAPTLLGTGAGAATEFNFETLRGGLDEVPDSQYGKCSVTPGSPDSLAVGQPLPGESMVVAGQRLTIPLAPASIGFTTAPDQAALFEIYVQPDGSVARAIRAQLDLEQTVTGVQIVDIDPGHPAGSFDLAFVAGPEPAVRFADGPQQKLDAPGEDFDGNQIYELLSGAGPGLPVRVQVTWQSLPTVTAVDAVEVSATEIGPRKMLLATLWWSGIKTGKLGVGTYGTTGVPVDQRSFGVTGASNLHPTLQLRLQRLQTDLRKNGWAEGGDSKLPGGRYLTVNGGVVWLGGVRTVVRTTTLLLPASQTIYVYVNELGSIVASTADPDAVDLIISTAPLLSTGPQRVARAYRARTGATSVLRVWDERTKLRGLDDSWRLGTSSNYDVFAQQVPRISVPVGQYGSAMSARAARVLISEHDGPAGLYKIRLYATNLITATDLLCGVEIVANAKWTPSFGPSFQFVWVPDNLQYDSVKYGFRGGGGISDLAHAKFQIKKRENYGFLYPHWFDLAADGNPTWDNAPFYFDPRTLFVQLGTTQQKLDSGDVIGAENPNSGVPFINTVLPKSLLKAWGTFDLTAAPAHTTIKAYNFIEPGGGNAGFSGNTFSVALYSGLRTFKMDRMPGGTAPGVRVAGTVIACDTAGLLDHADLVHTGAADPGGQTSVALTFSALGTTRVQYWVFGAQ